METLMQEVGVSPEGDAYDVLGYLGDKVSYPGSDKALIAAIQKIIDEKSVKPVMP